MRNKPNLAIRALRHLKAHYRSPFSVIAPRYIEEHAHPNPDVEEFACWLEETVRTMPRWSDRYEFWRQVAMQAADADFLRYVDPRTSVDQSAEPR